MATTAKPKAKGTKVRSSKRSRTQEERWKGPDAQGCHPSYREHITAKVRDQRAHERELLARAKQLEADGKLPPLATTTPPTPPAPPAPDGPPPPSPAPPAAPPGPPPTKPTGPAVGPRAWQRRRAPSS